MASLLFTCAALATMVAVTSAVDTGRVDGIFWDEWSDMIHAWPFGTEHERAVNINIDTST